METDEKTNSTVESLLRIFREDPWYLDEAIEEGLDGDEMTDRIINDYMQYEGYSNEIGYDMYSFGSDDLFSEWVIRLACWEVYYNVEDYMEQEDEE